VWANPPTRTDTEDFSAAVDDSHVSWLIAHALFTTRSITSATGTYKQALAGAQRMGYEFYMSAVKLTNVTATSPLEVDLRVQNKGVAPFYYDWPVELGVLDGSGNLVTTYATPWKMTGIFPTAAGEIPYVDWTYSNPTPRLSPGTYTLILHVINPLSNGKALKFANTAQDANRPGWLTLGTFAVQ
jgi:hypothetical protein